MTQHLRKNSQQSFLYSGGPDDPLRQKSKKKCVSAAIVAEIRIDGSWPQDSHREAISRSSHPLTSSSSSSSRYWDPFTSSSAAVSRVFDIGIPVWRLLLGMYFYIYNQWGNGDTDVACVGFGYRCDALFNRRWLLSGCSYWLFFSFFGKVFRSFEFFASSIIRIERSISYSFRFSNSYTPI